MVFIVLSLIVCCFHKPGNRVKFLLDVFNHMLALCLQGTVFSMSNHALSFDLKHLSTFVYGFDNLDLLRL